MSKNDLICIIGGGIAGLSAAWYLQKKGYRNVTLFEKKAEVGGKICTYSLNGFPQELGALEITEEYIYTREIIDELGLTLQKEVDRAVADISSGKVTLGLGSLMKDANGNPYPVLEVGRATAAYLYETGLRFSDYCNGPDMAGRQSGGIPPVLMKPFSEWLASIGSYMRTLTGLFDYGVLDYGYGPLNETPAAYITRYMNSSNFLMVLEMDIGINSWPRNIVEGFQQLPIRMAAKLNEIQPRTVKTSVNIEKITIQDGIRVYLEGESSPLKFDRIIMSCCLDSDLQYLIVDLPDTVKTLLKKVRYQDYWTTGVEVQGLPGKILGMYPPSNMNHPWALYQERPEQAAGIFYTIGDHMVDDKTVFANIKADSLKLKFQPAEFPFAMARWKYFPHVLSADLEQGFYSRLESLQGQNGLYFTGGLMAFETVHNIISYSKDLIENRNFF